MRSESNYPAVTVCSSSDKRIRIKVGLPPFSTIAHRPGIKRKRRCLPHAKLRSSSVASKL
ncbi:hypothetical protein A676_03708 [Salmonella enterica subsp. enterica serovar Enteritidis str. 2010K-0262]|uniref:Uncharacterized protein n=1 Tax=Salmonella enteritidis (strain 2009K0958) TaxID=1192586 RepID=A0A656IBD9_SALE2|nr:hypothetical protein A673_03579 [Salmonella enterica subsp. enterica serovar Enteritidis str. 2009K0958]EPI80394.1 hypothetical protein A676_03708 [Salmonella enterica subsp. enterica serovar Enteritidis str. 2010K-0262]EPI91290.1 hypothetical protein A674_00050 [Salmonella enterica subsp. enterica serovar Enteritidis str. 2009K1651]